MGFFGDLGKALVGQPTGQPNGNAQPQHASDGIHDDRGIKIMPKITIGHIHSHLDGDHLIVTAWIENNSDQQVRIDTSYLLQQKQQHMRELGPHQSHELKLYDGHAPQNENEHSAQITYRLHVNGDAFQNTYRVGYSIGSGNLRIVEALYPDSVRDI